MINVRRSLLVILGAALLSAGCAQHARVHHRRIVMDEVASSKLVEVFRSDGHQFTGVAVSSSGRMFVNFPRWGEPYRLAVGEVMKDGTLKPFPNPGWNRVSAAPVVEGSPPDLGFICVQSVTVDDTDHLWVLDPASPGLAGVVREGGGPKLVRFDLRQTSPESTARIYRFDASIAPEASYLNDLRVDTARGFAYLTDSGVGGIVVLDLNTGRARRPLDHHPSVRADPGVVPIIEGRPWALRSNGQTPQIHSDGIALSPDAEHLYYQALTGKRLYRIATAALRDQSLSAEGMSAAVEDLGETVVTDGMQMDSDGNLYFSALELDAIVVRTPGGEIVRHAQDPRLSWPDSFAIGPVRGPNLEPRRRPARSPVPQYLYVTSAQIHRASGFSADGSSPSEPYRVFRVPLYREE